MYRPAVLLLAACNDESVVLYGWLSSYNPPTRLPICPPARPPACLPARCCTMPSFGAFLQVIHMRLPFILSASFQVDIHYIYIFISRWAQSKASIVSTHTLTPSIYRILPCFQYITYTFNLPHRLFFNTKMPLLLSDGDVQ